ncbi:alpha-ketoglutarate-dependent dioxygenase AlkB family protein [Mucilaginibacter aquatilis]|uniref:Alpha-ketoglutarate-dependent dioxygenase AlkB n=1 Tax=Mucilaginibacter aquatilis TaxID=1517760 RepID=A0A6I4I8P6_9SPHI|nr:alpha-ketoglutarate-dependent dioxygenase AlkB [Mucilaginibacter aquatilis]MVN91635.1 alpha-ketoglutarate-dependent dioxygenase AlkB [Mucilaginibacter aquatilis]
MKLFNNNVQNLLPYDGEAIYHEGVLDPIEADKYFDIFLKEIAWVNDEAIMFGRRIITKRKVAWYGDADYKYSYSRIDRHALPWIDSLRMIKQQIEETCGKTFNSCLLNLYHNGSEGMSWHSDDEKELGNDPIIASLSLGVNRKFSFKHKQTKATVSLALNHGSVLLMQGSTQHYWLHSLPKSTKITGPRINLTFRNIIGG